MAGRRSDVRDRLRPIHTPAAAAPAAAAAAAAAAAWSSSRERDEETRQQSKIKLLFCLLERARGGRRGPAPNRKGTRRGNGERRRRENL